MNTNSIRRRASKTLIRSGESGPIVRAGCRAADTNFISASAETRGGVERSVGGQVFVADQRRHALNIRLDTPKVAGKLPEGRVVKSDGAVFVASGLASPAGIAPGPRDSIRRRVFAALIPRTIAPHGESGPIVRADSRAAEANPRVRHLGIRPFSILSERACLQGVADAGTYRSAA